MNLNRLMEIFIECTVHGAVWIPAALDHMQCTTPVLHQFCFINSVVLQIHKYAECVFNCLPPFLSVLFEYACRVLILPRMCTERQREREKEGSKQNWFKLDDAQSGVNLVSRLDLIRSVFERRARI